MLKQYYYSKYSVDFSWAYGDEHGDQELIESKELYSNDYEVYGSENTPFGTYDDKLWDLADRKSCYFLSSGRHVCIPTDVYTYPADINDPDPLNPQGYELVNVGTADFPDYRYELTDEQRSFFKSGKLVDFVDGEATGIVIYGWTDAVVASNSVIAKEELIEYRKLKTEVVNKYATKDDRYKEYEKDELIEKDIIKNENYPVNGYKDGFWWIRGEEYTIPAPTLLEPENALLININENDEIPEFIFKVNGRNLNQEEEEEEKTNDPYLGLASIYDPNDPEEENPDDTEPEPAKYHVRAEIGLESDFLNTIESQNSKDDQTNFYYKDPDDVWQPFPAAGVVDGTVVKYIPQISPESLEFGFYYWTATAWLTGLGYGRRAYPRLLIAITKTGPGEHYALIINGKPYKALELKVNESSNGEIGSIDIQLLNKS